MDKRYIFLALFIFIIIFFSIYFTINDTNFILPEPVQDSQQQPKPDQELENVNFTIYNNQQQLRIKLISKNVDNYTTTAKMDLTPFRAEAYSLLDGSLQYTITGETGTYYTAEHYLKVKRNVELKSELYQINSDKLDYYLDKNYLSGSGSVIITGNEFNAKADSFNSDLKLNNLKLIGQQKDFKPEVKFKEPEERKQND
ncbi:LPS export ABC transporter periplasmic protein LptC [Halanaerobium salsuginis]|jgi:LPS export ABC transporter protein LptC|uniref:LPS export ABC transporter protein LptC n=1 Tax=Halanaerobium salsuginis TaxID=29563 RepID=A0A1I4FNL1_9FIRM|nr:LPS export ABC transporter periplasmic protein LptC [Halanaerobium salsuginis]SFL18537.1 LPS export ABC transporter protein LptC [Halanaerobium salsuginis]